MDFLLQKIRETMQSQTRKFFRFLRCCFLPNELLQNFFGKYGQIMDFPLFLKRMALKKDKAVYL